MMNAINIAASALMVGGLKSAVTANNIANVNTPSFKARAVSVKEQSGGGVNTVGTTINTQAGTLVNTQSAYDFAGVSRYEAYVENNYEMGNRAFRINPNSEYKYTPEDKPNLTVDNEGVVFSQGEPIGALTSVGGNTAPNFTGEEIMQGYLVTSNVDIAKEMVDNIFNLNYFKLNTKAIQTSDEMMKTIIDIIA